jgi:hypothetical protein
VKIYVANVVTDSGDNYTYMYSSEPTKEQIITKVWKDEGEVEDLDWYLNSTSVEVYLQDVIDTDNSNIVYYGKFCIQKTYDTMAQRLTDSGVAIVSYNDIVPDGPTHKITFNALTREFISIELIEVIGK